MLYIALFLISFYCNNEIVPIPSCMAKHGVECTTVCIGVCIIIELINNLPMLVFLIISYGDFNVCNWYEKYLQIF